ncbi:MAG: hypothetical protein GEU80_17340 [Dehalococcoidia bacterium]|nr:hypothetical protein [Dehalococcoidia bacterium]
MGAFGLAGAALIGCADDDEPGSDGTATPGGNGTAAAGTAPNGPVSGGRFRGTEAGDPTSLDPMVSGSVSTKSIAAHVYSRLMRIDTAEDADPFDRLPTGDLAESVESDDGQHWTVKLRPGVKFHNIAPVSGRELTSEDVLFSYQRLSAPQSPNSTQLGSVVDVQAVDNYTLTFTLDAPSPEFHELLADGNLLYVQPVEADGGFDPVVQTIGTGPWILREYVPSSKLTFDKHPEYFVEGLPYMDGIDEAIIPEDANVKAQFEAGNVDFASISAEDLLDMQQRFPGGTWLPGTGNGMAWIAFSGKDMSPDAVWRDERFRQGVSMSVDRAALLDFAGNASRLLDAGFDFTTLTRWNNIPEPCAFGPRFWLDPQSEGQGPSSTYFQYNPDEARKMYEAVGVGQQPIPYMYTDRYGDVFTKVVEATGGMLTDAGLVVEQQFQDYNSVYITNTFVGNFHGVVYGLESQLTPGGYAERFFGQDPANHGRVHEPEMEEMLVAQRTELDPDARTEILYNMQRRQGEMMYYIPAQSTSSTQWSGYSSRVRGLRRTRGYGAGTDVFANVWLSA